MQSVSCPAEEREPKTGDTFECTAVAPGGGTMTVKVTQEDDEGSVRWIVMRTTVVKTTDAEEFLAAMLKEKSGEEVTVECGSGITVGGAVGATFECTATSASGEQVVFVGKQEDDMGNVSWDVKGAGAEATGPAAATE